VKSFGTWRGRGGVNKNDKLDFAGFTFRSDFGAIDEDGWFTPVTDLRATTAREILVVTAYRGRPDRFTFKTKQEPDYTCIQTGEPRRAREPVHGPPRAMAQRYARSSPSQRRTRNSRQGSTCTETPRT
jgi:hypothetical protein